MPQSLAKFGEELFTAVQPGQRNPTDFASRPTADEMTKGALLLKQKGAKNVESYLQLINTVGELTLGNGATQL